MLDTLYSQIGAVLWLGVCAFALLKGDEPERITSGALVAAWLATLAIHRETGEVEVLDEGAPYLIGHINNLKIVGYRNMST